MPARRHGREIRARLDLADLNEMDAVVWSLQLHHWARSSSPKRKCLNFSGADRATELLDRMAAALAAARIVASSFGDRPARSGQTTRCVRRARGGPETA